MALLLPQMAIRVLHLARVINRYDFIDTIVRHLPRDRFTVEVATFLKEANIEDPAYAAVGIPHHLLPVPAMDAYPSYLLAAWKLHRLVRRRQIHLLHTHHYYEGLIGALVRRWNPQLRFVLHRHYTYDVLLLPGLKKKALLRAERWSYRQADALVVPTQTIAQIVRKSHSTLQTPLHEIPYGFDWEAPRYRPLTLEERQTTRQRYGAGEETVVIANLGSHRRQKGQFELIQAFSRVFAQQRNIRLWLVGEGPDTPALRERAQQLRLTEPEADPPCRFFGWQKADQVRLLLGSCDLVVHPTHSEAFPQVMVEALIHQRPLVITPVSGVKEWLRHPQDAWIIPIQDEAALQEALTVLVTNKALRQEMGRQAAARLRSQLAYSTVNAHYETLYQRLCSR